MVEHPYPWFAQYESGIAHEVSISEMDSLLDIFDEACSVYADHTAFVGLGHEISYRELHELAVTFAHALVSIGVQPGDRVALMMPNILQYPVVLFGVLLAGGVVVNCNPLYTPRELAFQLQDSGAETIVVLANFANTVAQVMPDVSLRKVVVTEVGDLMGFRGHLINWVLKYIKRVVPSVSLAHKVSLHEFMHEGVQNPAPTLPRRQGGDLAFLQYTGGTTGFPKAAMLSHGNMVANLRQVSEWLKGVMRPGRECIVTALPLYHIFSLTANCFTFLKLGAKNVLIPNPKDMPAFIKALRAQPFTAITGVNTLFNGLLHQAEFRAMDFSQLKLALGGGMAVQAEVSRRWQELTGHPIVQAYGLTETSPGATMNPLHLEQFNGSIGLPIPSTEIVIRDEQGVTLETGQEGEICIRGPQVMRGYWQKSEETQAVFYPDGFLRTGDWGRVDPEGFFYLLDRKKDMIKVSGFNVYPNEIEEVVAHHPGVLEVAALGVPDEHSGQAIKLFVVLKDLKVTEQDILNFCRGQLTGYKIPRHIEFRTELPHSNVGKVLRRLLIPMASSG